MFRFATPYAFFLFLPLVAAAWWIYRRRIHAGLLFAPMHRLPAQGRSWRTAAGLILPALVLAGLALAIIALARPQTFFSRTAHTSEAIAIQMVVDVSGSMNALDFATMDKPDTTRLAVVKRTFADFVERRPDDLIGLVTFGGFATSLVPLTIDHDALLHVLAGVEVPSQKYSSQQEVVNAEELATAIGDGLATGCARLKDAELKSRIIVLLTDGESNTGLITPDKAMQLAAKLGIKVYTIGVGSTGIANAKFNDPFGRTVVGQIQVRIDEVLLKKIATTTGGRYFNVQNPRGLQEALDEIDQLEKTEVSREIYSQYDEQFPRFLIPGIILLAVGLCLNIAVTRRVL